MCVCVCVRLEDAVSGILGVIGSWFGALTWYLDASDLSMSTGHSTATHSAQIRTLKAC